MPNVEPKKQENGKAALRAKKAVPKKNKKAAAPVVAPPSSLGTAKVSKKKNAKRKLPSAGKAEKKIIAKPKAKTAVRKKASAAAATDPKLSSSASAARAVSKDMKERQAQRMSQYRRRLTMEKRVLEFWDKVGGSALLIDITSGGVTRHGRPHIVGSGRFSPGFRKLTMHTVLKRIIDDDKADWRKAAKEMNMQTFFHKMAMEDFGVAQISNAAADADMADSSGEISE